LSHPLSLHDALPISPSPSTPQYPPSVAATPASPAPLPIEQSTTRASQLQREGRVESNWLESEPAHLDSLAAMLARAPRPVHLLGEGIPYHQKFIPPGDSSIIVTPEDQWRARASVVARIGQEMSARGEFADVFALTPIYIR